MIIDAWIQHPSPQMLADPMFDAIKRWVGGTIPESIPHAFTLSQMDAAGGLAGLGLGRGDKITLYAANSWEWIVSYYAIARLGAVINPVNTMLTPDEIEYVVTDCGAKAIIASPEKVAATRRSSMARRWS